MKRLKGMDATESIVLRYALRRNNRLARILP